MMKSLTLNPEQKRVDAILERNPDGSKVVMYLGPRNIGKTFMACHWVFDNIGKAPNILYLDRHVQPNGMREFQKIYDDFTGMKPRMRRHSSPLSLLGFSNGSSLLFDTMNGITHKVRGLHYDLIILDDTDIECSNTILMELLPRTKQMFIVNSNFPTRGDGLEIRNMLNENLIISSTKTHSSPTTIQVPFIGKTTAYAYIDDIDLTLPTKVKITLKSKEDFALDKEEWKNLSDDMSMPIWLKNYQNIIKVVDIQNKFVHNDIGYLHNAHAIFKM